jgi:hypothetical protein
MGNMKRLGILLILITALAHHHQSWSFKIEGEEPLIKVNPYKEVTLVCQAGPDLWLLTREYTKPTVQLKDIVNLVEIKSGNPDYYFRTRPPLHMPTNRNLHWIKIERMGDYCWAAQNKELVAIVNGQYKTKDCKIKNIKLDFPWNFINVLNTHYLAILSELEDKKENLKLEKKLASNKTKEKPALWEILEDDDEEENNDEKYGNFDNFLNSIREEKEEVIKEEGEK